MIAWPMLAKERMQVLYMHGQGLPNDRMRRRRESPQVCCRHGADPDDMAGDIMTGNMFRIEMQPSSASLEADLAVEPPASTKFDAGIAAIQGLTRRLGAHQLSVVLPIGPRRTGMPRRDHSTSETDGCTLLINALQLS